MKTISDECTTFLIGQIESNIEEINTGIEEGIYEYEENTELLERLNKALTELKGTDHNTRPPIKYLFIGIEIQDGERRHYHRVLHTTRANSIEFAAERYAATFWGEPDGHNGDWWDLGEIAARLVRVKELTKEQYDWMDSIMNR